MIFLYFFTTFLRLLGSYSVREIMQHPVLNVTIKKHVTFFYNGEKYQGIEGDPVSSALIANDIHIFSLHHKNHAAQGIFCANGQCSHCTVLINGSPLKSCITALEKNMDVRILDGLPDLPLKDKTLGKTRSIIHVCDVLIVGGGPSGLTAALELADNGFKVLIAEDKSQLGGKLLLQTHKFFGSKADCYAGTRGHEIARLLEKQVMEHPSITVFTDTMVAAIYKDQKAGLFVKNTSYELVDFKGLIVSAGARERSLVFPGNHLPGIYGAGAFQTLVNRDLIRSSDEIFIVGSGNVGLIAAYHALQAGIRVKGICDILPEPGGYKVHADKIKRMGVPIYLNHTILHAEGEDKIKDVTIAEVDEQWHPILSTSKTFNVDTLLVAVGLASIDGFYDMAKEFGFPVVKAGDADEIAEASSAMFGGRIAGLTMAQKLGLDITIDQSFFEKAEILKSHPGDIFPRQMITVSEKFQPVIHCIQEIPCNPCETICPVNAITLNPRKGNIMDVPEYTGDCIGCMKCVTICPGLAITLVKKLNDKKAEVVLPYEFLVDFEVGDELPLTDRDGNFLERGLVKKIRFDKKTLTTMLILETSLKNAQEIAGVRVQAEDKIKELPQASYSYLPDDAIVCRCEMVTIKEVKEYIIEHDVRDVNQLKNIRVGMGSCGGKNCSLLLPRIYKELDIPFKEVSPPTSRPLSVEIPMHILINESDEEGE
jgi:NADPH-dependent 2,4-dienoyl-CoA reductase/sulfur reductase-like enzyme/Fe-S-cluster-containing hydrogenase component 2/bacterioferritin-associated ferredoxin